MEGKEQRMGSTIGIKIANGEFYSIVEEESSGKKRLILTTVHDGQHSVQIDLYKSFTKTMADALYIGSLVVENIKSRPRGEPSIELTIASDADGNISADAIDLDPSSRKEHQYLNVSLKSLDDDNRDYEIPDFELEQNEHPPMGLYGKAQAIRDKKKRSVPWIAIICAAIILILLILGLWFFVLRGKPSAANRPSPPAAVSQPQNTNETAPEPVQPEPQPAPVIAEVPPAPPPVIEAPAKAPAPAPQPVRKRTPPPVASYKVPATIPAQGVVYRIRWGDTLWDIAEAFYRNPWLYPRIARFNNIRNPNLIISGTDIRIPPKN